MRPLSLTRGAFGVVLSLDVAVVIGGPGLPSVAFHVLVGRDVVDVAHGISFRRAETCGLLRGSACLLVVLPAVVLPTESLSYTRQGVSGDCCAQLGIVAADPAGNRAFQ